MTKININTFFSKKHKSFIKFLIKQGWTEEKNICDYWFTNKARLLKELYQQYPLYRNGNEYLEKIETRIRWESELGKNFVYKLKNYLNIEQEKLRKLATPKNPFKGFFEEIDVSKVTVKYNNKTIYIEKFSKLFDTNTKIIGQIDLRGIPLHNFRIDNITLSNICFNYSDFSYSHIQQCKLKNITFAWCDFKGSHISGARIDNNTHFSGCNFCNTYIYLSN